MGYRRAQLAAYSSCDFDLHRAAAGQRRDADRAPRVPAGWLTEDVEQHSARAVDNRGLLVKAWCGRDETGNRDEPLDPIEEGRRTTGVDYVAGLNAREAFYAEHWN